MSGRQREGRRLRGPRVPAGRLPVRRGLDLVWAWMAILIITGCFHFYRGAVVDGAIYLAVALLLTLDAVGLLPGHRTPAARRLPHAPLVLGSVALALPLLLAPLNGLIDALVVGGIGVVVLVAAWLDPQREPSERRRPRPSGRPLRRSAVLWSCVALFLCIWELAAYLLGRPSAAAEYAFPPLSDLLDPVVQSVVGRVVLIAAWLAGGVALLRRGRHP